MNNKTKAVIAGGVVAAAIFLYLGKAGTAQFVCDICGEKFRTQADLSEHLLTHDIYACEYCGAQFTSAGDLALHMEAEHQLLCPYCDQVFPTEELLQAHIDSSHFVCPTCGDVFSSSAARQAHIVEEHWLRCPVCGRSFPTQADLDAHFASGHATYVTGTVSNATTGAVLGGVAIACIRSGGGVIGTTITAANGTYEFRALLAVPHSFSFTKTGYTPKSLVIEIVLGPNVVNCAMVPYGGPEPM